MDRLSELGQGFGQDNQLRVVDIWHVAAAVAGINVAAVTAAAVVTAAVATAITAAAVVAVHLVLY